MLADGTNLQVRASNKVLLALFVSGFVLLFSRPEVNETVYKLPFLLGSPNINEFYLFSILLQSIITLVFCQSFIGLMEAAKFAHVKIKALKCDVELECNSKNYTKEIVQLYNILVASGITKLSFLTNSLIYSDLRLLRGVGYLYYFFLFIIAFVCVCIVPMMFLTVFYYRLLSLNDVPIILYISTQFLAANAAFALLIVAKNLFQYYYIAMQSWGWFKKG